MSNEPAELFNRGHHFAAHEAWEELWRAEAEPLRKRRLQGLAQLAAALVKATQGNARGAALLAEKARASLEAAGAGDDPWDVGRALKELPAWLDAPASARVHARSTQR